MNNGGTHDEKREWWKMKEVMMKKENEKREWREG